MGDKWLGHTWDVDFENGRRWHLDGGNYHSLYWMYTVFGFLNGTESREQILGNHKTIHDYGCAEGDGTVVLRCFYPLATITGFDLWPGAVKLAKERWTGSGVEFKVGDVCRPKYACDLMISLQTTDHVDDVAASVKRCLEKSKVFILAWADLPLRDTHPSQDPSWFDNVPQPTELGTVPMHRLDPETNMVLTDRIQIFCWVNP